MTGERWRVAIIQGDDPFVSPVVMSADEAKEQVALEAQMHEDFGWSVIRRGDTECECHGLVGDAAGIVRTVTALAFDPMSDTQVTQ